MPLRANSRGMAALTLSMFAFAANDLIVKNVIQTLPVGEVIAVRGIMTAALLAITLGLAGQISPFALQTISDRRVLVRALLEGVATSLFTVALLRVPIAEASAVVMISPLIIAAVSVVFLKEQVGWRRVTAISVGFVGVLLVVKPSPGVFDPWILFAIACAFASATRDLLTKGLDPKLPVAMVSLMSAAAVALAGFIMSIWEGWRPIDMRDFVALAVMAALLALGNFLTVVAFRGADVSAVVPFRYSYLLWAGLGGAVFFSEVLDGLALAGALLIVLSGLYTLHRERVRRLSAVARNGGS